MPDTVTPLTIPTRFNGPPASGNGGYVGGLLAERLGLASVEVTLRAPPPLDRPLALRAGDAGGLDLLDGERLLAQARAAELALEIPPVPSPEYAAAAGAIGRMRAHGRGGDPYRRCFGCGIDREDGLLIVPSPVGDEGVVATDWTPQATLAEPDGTLSAPIAWAALDCPAGFAWSHRLPDDAQMVTGRITARVDVPLRAGERYVVLGWPIARDGRKLHAGTAIVDGEGVVRARSLQLWLLLQA
jgi:hypothetical protein